MSHSRAVSFISSLQHLGVAAAVARRRGNAVGYPSLIQRVIARSAYDDVFYVQCVCTWPRLINADGA